MTHLQLTLYAVALAASLGAAILAVASLFGPDPMERRRYRGGDQAHQLAEPHQAIQRPDGSWWPSPLEAQRLDQLDRLAADGRISHVERLTLGPHDPATCTVCNRP